jgi:drug/metabolite transporter (DMT)-like permease
VSSRRFSYIDVLLLLMTLIWGTNYSIVKHAFAEVDPQAFNAARMVIASTLFLSISALARTRERTTHATSAAASIFFTPDPVTRRDWLGIAALGLIGHAAYQFLFIGGLARTSVSNSSLLLAATPVLIALMSAAAGQDRIGRLHWVGILLSMAGIYLVVGHGAPEGRGSRSGDAMMVAAVCCWALYTLGAQRLMRRHSPVGVTGYSMACGTLIYVPLTYPHIAATNWTALSHGAWTALLYSAVFALCDAYTIWYMAVREIGSARTSVYSNLVPIVAMLTAVAFLGEVMTSARLAGAAAVLLGVALTRVGKTAPIVCPEE